MYKKKFNNNNNNNNKNSNNSQIFDVIIYSIPKTVSQTLFYSF